MWSGINFVIGLKGKNALRPKVEDYRKRDGEEYAYVCEEPRSQEEFLEGGDLAYRLFLRTYTERKSWLVVNNTSRT